MNHFTPIIGKSLYTYLDINYNSEIPTTESISNVFPDNPVKFKANNNFSSSFKFYTYITISGNENWKSENFDLEHLLNIQNKREKIVTGT